MLYKTHKTTLIYRTYETHRPHKPHGSYCAFFVALLLQFLLLLLPFTAKAQIIIGGNVYGGGNKGEVKGNTRVRVRAGNIGVRPLESVDVPSENPRGKVFGGARMANVGGNAYVNIDGENASDFILINQVYGGNDISGVVGKDGTAKTLPDELAGNPDGVDKSWDAFVHISTKMKEEGGKTVPDDTQKTFIGQAFAGGNGDFQYTEEDNPDKPLKDGDDFIILSGEQVIAISSTPFNRPTLDRTYLDVRGGTIGYAYGGGNNATIDSAAVIHLENPSKVVTDINVDAEGKESDSESATNLVTTARLVDMGVNTVYTYASSDAFQVNSLFGGNNKDTMAIQPQWNLQSGKVRFLYSGGNRGAMICENGLLLPITPNPDNEYPLVINEVYGGCRMADVRPMTWNSTTNRYEDVDFVSGIVKSHPYQFPNNLAARVIVAGGDINNVYGGNDVRGKVHFGNAIGIHTSIRGNVYGGGNGNYAYTDNANLKDNDTYNDFYYDPKGRDAVEALLDVRPNTEQVSINLRGTADKKTIIGGSVFVGGNSATLQADDRHRGLTDYPMTVLKIGSHVIAENVFLGNNGEGMVTTEEAGPTTPEGVLRTFRRRDISTDGSVFNTMDLTQPSQMKTYMKGVTLGHVPKLIVEGTEPTDRFTYEPYTSYIGSLYYGGNRGSMVYSGTNNITPNAPIYIYNKLVGGCNNANIAKTAFNARYEGGILGDDNEQRNGYDGNRIVMNISKIRIEPRRLNSAGTALEWNTVMKYDLFTPVPSGTILTAKKTYYTSATGEGKFVAVGTEEATGSNYYSRIDDYKKDWSTASAGKASDDDINRRLLGGNLYGGCNESGHVNGNVVINLNGNLHDRKKIFADFVGQEKGDNILYDYEEYTLQEPLNSGVILNEQGMDVLGDALNVYGGGKGEETQIWGSTTVNHTRGYTFQIFGGSENGVIGKGDWDEEQNKYIYPTEPNEKYSTYVNLDGPASHPGVPRADDSSEDIPDVEFIYGGGYDGLIMGSTHVNLDYGRLFNVFTGSCNANILGHTETYIGRNGFPYLRDHIYGGNDLGGHILGTADFSGRIRDYDGDKTMIYGYDASSPSVIPDVVKASSYVEYIQGDVKSIFGGCYGDYDYDDEFSDITEPWMDNAFVNIRPENNAKSRIEKVYGAGQGGSGNYPVHEGDFMQNRSYVFVDIPEPMLNFEATAVFGAGMNNGLGMNGPEPKNEPAADASDEEKAAYAAYMSADMSKHSATIDLIRGRLGNVYGGSYNEGIVRRSVVNVPEGSTIDVKNIFGGGYGADINIPCDVYESKVNYDSEDATVRENIYGGNNHFDRTLYTQVNISKPVWQNKTKGYLASVFGAGYGEETWAQYTEVNLLPGAKVYEVYGGGNNGKVFNKETLEKWKEQADDEWNSLTPEKQAETPQLELRLHEYTENGLDNPLAHKTELGGKYNTNVHIHEGATVLNYAYGGGLGDDKRPDSGCGDVYGTTYIDLLGGRVVKDIYAAGTTGSVKDGYGAENFTARTTAYIKGGTCRNVYGGGWKGSVGAHTGDITASPADDIPGETQVVIGRLEDDVRADSLALAAEGINKHGFYYGRPAIQRNAYGGGEGGAVYGLANLTFNNGYIGYVYNPDGTDIEKTENLDERYEEKIEDDTKETPNTFLTDAGCIFGGGYVDNSSVDKTRLYLYGGHVRNSVFGGGEIAAIGRGTINRRVSGGKTVYELNQLYRPGKTNIEMYSGHVHRNVFGGGRGYDNLGKHGTLDSDGFVFGQTEVHIHGGEIGTEAGLAQNDGNVFGGGDIGYVYSAYENTDGTFGRGMKDGVRYDGLYQGYYYKHDWDVKGSFVEEIVGSGTERNFTEDCKVLIEPKCKVIGSGVSFTNIHYNIGESVSSEDLAYLNADPKTNADHLAKIDVKGKVSHADGITFSRSYSTGSYVPIAALNTLKNKTADSGKWGNLDPSGIIIHNAVFAGGNTSPGSGAAYANATSVFGNATASIHDVYNRDLITMGTRHTGGLYGDGSLTFVDGYRELNITNYGTDYYSIKEEIDIDTYHTLPAREAAYYELRYKCEKECEDKDGTHYKPAKTEGGTTTKASTISADDLLVLFVNNDGTSVQVDATGKRVTSGGTAVLSKEDEKWIPNPDYWTENGVLPVYAGRLMNSIQRADFCGVWGSRMVMQGAQDRVPEEVDYTNYTINRVREVSLNKKVTTAGDTDDKNKEHGNYFGIYNIVNYLGALTSDVDFGDGGNPETDGSDVGRGDVRTSANVDESYEPDYVGQTFYGWKKNHWQERKRNNGKSHNKVALASGVYLELTSELSTGEGLYEKDWGHITGVVELDLINVQPGIGGGFVYAKNVHGKRTRMNRKNTTLTSLNNRAVTQWDFEYDQDDEDKKEWQTSGNFVHSSQTIIDDCYNIGAKYKDNYMPPGGVPAHYWYIKGEIYVYDQYISAYTGIPHAYSETVEIPLTITAASHGSMKLLNVQPNYYAYYSSPGVELENDKKVIINDKAYYKNDPISFWDYFLLSNSEKGLFVPMTYVNCITCTIDGEEYEAGTYIMSEDDFDAFTAEPGGHTYTDAQGNPILDANKNVAGTDYIFRQSNNLSHDKGYILTYRVNNPSDWNTWYTPKANTTGSKVKEGDYKNYTPEDKAKYEDGPTYRLTATDAGMLLGQQSYKEGDIIAEDVKTVYDAIKEAHSGAIPNPDPEDDDYQERKQATFERAWIVTDQVTITSGGETRHQNPGATVSATEASASAYSGKAAEAYVCTSTIQLSKTEFIYVDTKMTAAERTAYYNRFKDGTDAEKKIAAEIMASIVPAYYCTSDGKYGGNYYESGKSYRGLEAWSAMSESDRQQFTFNYDALDLLIDPTYSDLDTRLIANKYQYDGKDAEGVPYTTATQASSNPAGYSLTKPIDYTATYNGDETTTYNGVTLENGREYSREKYEKLPNEQRHYTAITVKNGVKVDDTYKVYVVNEAFQVGSTPYAIGSVIDAATYTGLADKSSITVLTFPNPGGDNPIYYYCRENYTIGENGSGVSVSNAADVAALNSESDTITVKGNYNDNDEVPVGLVISQAYYDQLKTNNKQQNFTIHGIAPTEISTLYVSRESDIYNLSQEKIVTVVYQYDYEEVQASGAITPVTERHVVNIHLNFKSGVPIVEDIRKPDIILPGDLITLGAPNIIPGAYELTGSGWELFEKKGDAESHINGIEYDPIHEPLYWYQNDWYVAYYAKTYLGRTYSNFVPVSVANYHDLKKVMETKQHHYYVDNPNVLRFPKIYVNDYSNDAEGSKNGLDLLKSLFDLSVLSSPTVNEDGIITNGDFTGHHTLNSRVHAGGNLEFFLRTDLDHSGSSWTPIANGAQCFEGTLHGDGHTISGLDHSLFGRLCGSIYNLGVKGSFSTAGIVDTGDGYVENCWTNTTGTPDGSVYAVFGNPTDEEPETKQMVNCYYQDTKTYKTTANSHGVATPKPDKAFYNGEVAYDLNGFYLYKRYNDHASPAGATTYKYWAPGNGNAVNADTDTPLDGSYASNRELCSSGYQPTPMPVGYTVQKYVENRFADGDFVYAAGTIPDSEDERLYTYMEDEEMKSAYLPIWPDDYLFFGQMLNYGHLAGRAHQETPAAVKRSDGRVLTDADGNRVYRAPAYFRSKTMDVAHFNPYAVFAQSKNDEPAVIAYKNMTAIDFTDEKFGRYDTYKTYGKGSVDGSADGLPTMFYPPLLDDDGITGFLNVDLTKNLLVYTAEPGTATAAEKTAQTVSDYLIDPTYRETDSQYRTVDYHNPVDIKGHWVERTGGDFVATRDHLLVDLNDFNAPISYQFMPTKLMWHQRMPDQYVEPVWSNDPTPTRSTKGWEAISLPFSAELVTTEQKGELTHFYSGSYDYFEDNVPKKDATKEKAGHEYWLRGFTAITDTGDPSVYAANFKYPTSASTDATKTVANTFLWDYYYNAESGHQHKDRNKDIYQTYYQSERTYAQYPQLGKSTPYLIGFPGLTYYEFDLSGNFEPTTTDKDAPAPGKLSPQWITFASNKGETIGVSDYETVKTADNKEAGVTFSSSSYDYTFKPNYMNEDFEAGTDTYTLATDGTSFDKVPASGDATPVSAFRPYFVSAAKASGARGQARRIVFSNISDGFDDDQEDEDCGDGSLTISSRLRHIIVSSTLKKPRTVTIFTASGIRLTTFTICPGQTVETRVSLPGFYVVNKTKIAVR